MKLKYYLRGAGIGIVATTLVFSIANAVSSANKRLVTGTEQTSTESSILAYTQKDTQAETIKQEEETTKEQTTVVQEETTTQEETTIGQETTAAGEGQRCTCGCKAHGKAHGGTMFVQVPAMVHRSIRTGNTRPAADPGSTLSAGR